MDAKEMDATRSKFLQRLFERSDGNTDSWHSVKEIAREIDIGDTGHEIARYLQAEGLVRLDGDTIYITHDGVKRAESLKESNSIWGFFQFKPMFHGVGIDFKGLLRWLVRKVKGLPPPPGGQAER